MVAGHPGAVEEMSRCDGPAGVIVREHRAVRVGLALPAGKRFYLAMVAGNRDPEVFDDPDRTPVPPLAHRLHSPTVEF